MLSVWLYASRQEHYMIYQLLITPFCVMLGFQISPLTGRSFQHTIIFFSGTEWMQLKECLQFNRQKFFSFSLQCHNSSTVLQMSVTFRILPLTVDMKSCQGQKMTGGGSALLHIELCVKMFILQMSLYRMRKSIWNCFPCTYIVPRLVFLWSWMERLMIEWHVDGVADNWSGHKCSDKHETA